MGNEASVSANGRLLLTKYEDFYGDCQAHWGLYDLEKVTLVKAWKRRQSYGEGLFMLMPGDSFQVLEIDYKRSRVILRDFGKKNEEEEKVGSRSLKV